MKKLNNACYFLVLCLCMSSLAHAQETSGSGDRVTLRARQFRFRLEPGGSFTFTLPNVDNPIRIEVIRRFANGGFDKGLDKSELMWALVNVDRKAGQITWIGTDSAGDVIASNSLNAQFPIATIFLDAPPDQLATLTVANAVARTLTVTQIAGQTKLAGLYLVRMYY
jgi:hypothetical protein